MSKKENTQSVQGVPSNQVTVTSLKKARSDNPSLHLLYVKQACTHILAINKAISDLGRFSNLNLMDAQAALCEERRNLINTDPAAYDADEILRELMPYIKKPLRYTTQAEQREQGRHEKEAS